MVAASLTQVSSLWEEYYYESQTCLTPESTPDERLGIVSTITCDMRRRFIPLIRDKSSSENTQICNCRHKQLYLSRHQTILTTCGLTIGSEADSQGRRQFDGSWGNLYQYCLHAICQEDHRPRGTRFTRGPRSDQPRGNELRHSRSRMLSRPPDQHAS